MREDGAVINSGSQCPFEGCVAGRAARNVEILVCYWKMWKSFSVIGKFLVKGI